MEATATRMPGLFFLFLPGRQGGAKEARSEKAPIHATETSFRHFGAIRKSFKA